VDIVTFGGLYSGLNDVIRAITKNRLSDYYTKNTSRFRFGYTGLTTRYQEETVGLTSGKVNDLHQIGGSFLNSPREPQPVGELIDNDISYVHPMSRFVTRGEEICNTCDVAHLKASKHKMGIKILKLMRRHSDFIDSNTPLAPSHGDLYLIPEVPLDLNESLEIHQHIVIVMTENAGQKSLKKLLSKKKWLPLNQHFPFPLWKKWGSCI
jgi:6-phosphofructokinase 1